MDEIPEIQIINKEHYFTQEVVSLPDELGYPPLAPSSIRLRTTVLGLSASNLNVAKVAFLFNWWDAYPLPESLKAGPGGDDRAKYGRTGTWGYAEVLDSTAAFVSKGSYLFGYVPIGTLAFDVAVQPGEAANHVIVSCAHRRHMPFYNLYIAVPTTSIKGDLAAKSDSLAYDALIRIMYETAHLLGRFVFSVDPEKSIAPGAGLSNAWSAERADLTDAAVVFLAPGSKVGLCLARILRHGRAGAKPRMVVAAASDFSKQFVLSTGAYDHVISTSSSPLQALSELNDGDLPSKVVLIDFGGRSGVAQRWAAELDAGPSIPSVLLLSVGSAISQMQSQTLLSVLQTPQRDYFVRVSLSHMRDRAVAKVGYEKYFEGLEGAWLQFKQEGIPSLKFSWGSGVTDVRKGWDRLVNGRIQPDEGLVYAL